MRMCEPPEDASLAFEAFLTTLTHQCQIEKLHCDLALESAVVSFRQPHTAHSALPDLSEQRVHTERLAAQPDSRPAEGIATLEKAFLAHDAVLAQKNFELL